MLRTHSFSDLEARNVRHGAAFLEHCRIVNGLNCELYYKRCESLGDRGLALDSAASWDLKL